MTKCSCIEARPWFSSVIVYQNQDYISANRHCWRLGMASTAKWEQCVHKNRKYTKQTAIVEIPASPSIRHCAFSCADRLRGGKPNIGHEWENQCNKLISSPMCPQWYPLSPKKSGTRMCRIIALVGVGAGIKSLSHLVN
eukprot:sb/3474376/